MFAIFEGWRRKAGVVTLVTACVLMGWWIRSLTSHDFIVIWELSITSECGEVLFGIRDVRFSKSPSWDTVPYEGAHYGLQSGQQFGVVPYWLIVLPLTLLSAYLLLSKATASMPESRCRHKENLIRSTFSFPPSTLWPLRPPRLGEKQPKRNEG